ncbi:MAG: RNA polymerase sigma factor [Bacteroidales bacterium]
MKQKSKQELFSSVYNDYRHKIYRICYAYIYQKEEVDDLFQEIMVNIWNGLERFRGESTIGTWVYRIAVNSALFYNRKFKRYAEINVKPDLCLVNTLEHHLGEDPHDVVHERLDQLAKAISQLEKQDRLIISLLLEGLSYEEISEVVGITPNYVGVKVNRIKKQLKELIKDEQQ